MDVQMDQYALEMTNIRGELADFDMFIMLSIAK